MQNIYETFQFQAIKDHLLEYAKTELAKVYIDELAMLENANAVNNALEDVVTTYESSYERNFAR